jgi:hypothetical protein
MPDKQDEKPAAMPQQTVRPMTPDEIRAAEAATRNAIYDEVMERDAVNGPEGGRYLVGDQMVDSEGRPVKDKKAE